jgi:hypothetical protein
VELEKRHAEAGGRQAVKQQVEDGSGFQWRQFRKTQLDTRYLSIEWIPVWGQAVGRANVLLPKLKTAFHIQRDEVLGTRQDSNQKG